MKKGVLLLLFFCVGCTTTSSSVQTELERNQYTQAVDRSTAEDAMHAPARLMVRLEAALASYRLKEAVTLAKTIEQLGLAQDNPIRLQAKSIQLSAEAVLNQLKLAEGTYQIERSTFEKGLEERSLPAAGQLDVVFDKQDGLIATIDYQHFGRRDAPRNGTEYVRFEPDLSARLPLPEGVAYYNFNPSGLFITVESPDGKCTYQLKKIKGNEAQQTNAFLN